MCIIAKAAIRWESLYLLRDTRENEPYESAGNLSKQSHCRDGTTDGKQFWDDPPKE